MQRTAEQAACLLIQRFSQLKRLSINDQAGACPRRQAVILRIFQGARGARFDTIAAEQAASQVDARSAVDDRHRICRAACGTALTALITFRSINDGQAAESVGDFRRSVDWEPDRAMPLTKAFSEDAEHLVTHRSCPQYDRLKLLLQTGNSEIGWLRSAIAKPTQLWNDGSMTL